MLNYNLEPMQIYLLLLLWSSSLDARIDIAWFFSPSSSTIRWHFHKFAWDVQVKFDNLNAIHLLILNA